MFRTLRGQYFLGSFITFVATLVLVLWNAHHLLGQATEERFEAERQAFGPLLAARDYATISEVVHENTRGQHLTFVEVLDSRSLRVASASEENRPGARLIGALVLLAGMLLPARIRAALTSFRPDPSRPTTAPTSALRPVSAAELVALEHFVAGARKALAAAR